jgi:hypothetical protein
MKQINRQESEGEAWVEKTRRRRRKSNAHWKNEKVRMKCGGQPTGLQVM